MPPSHRDHLQSTFDDHPSLAASLEDFESSSETQSSPTLQIPSQHSGFRSGVTDFDSEPESSDSAGPWSPPAWRKPASGWFQNNPRLGTASMAEPYRSPARSRDSSPLHGFPHAPNPEEPDVMLPAEVPLPGSPTKHRSPSPSPEPQEDCGQDAAGDTNEDMQHVNNYFRFALRAEVQQRTAPFEAAQRFWEHLTKSKTSLISYLFTIFSAIVVLRNLVQAPDLGPGPDLIRVAGLARSFEPLIHYSENGVQQIAELQETGVAVWDLGESVRQSNMTSGPIIVRELDELSSGLTRLAEELTRFFADVDGDVDNILLVIEWTKRELMQVAQQVPSTISSIIENLSLSVQSVGGPGFSASIHNLLGLTNAQITKATLSRTFHEFLAALEESINRELTKSTVLFALFEASDRQFLNLQRSVARETNSQDALRDAELATLWGKLIGPSRSRLRKYEKNQQLLRNLRERTVHNKLVLVEHNQRLLSLKANLEMLRQRLVSPLMRRENVSTASIAEQIQGLDGTYELLGGARHRQEEKKFESLYGPSGRVASAGLGRRFIDVGGS